MKARRLLAVARKEGMSQEIKVWAKIKFVGMICHNETAVNSSCFFGDYMNEIFT